MVAGTTASEVIAVLEPQIDDLKKEFRKFAEAALLDRRALAIVQAQHNGRISTLEKGAVNNVGPAAAQPLAIFTAVAPWLLKFSVAGAFIAFGVNMPAAVTALAGILK